MTTRFSCDFSCKTEAMPHFWEHCVGSGHATLALRADWRAQLKQCHEEPGFRHFRFHELLDEGWIAPACFGIDQGLVMMIENARSGLSWKLTRNSTLIKRGLKALGFAGGWLQ